MLLRDSIALQVLPISAVNLIKLRTSATFPVERLKGFAAQAVWLHSGIRLWIVGLIATKLNLFAIPVTATFSCNSKLNKFEGKR